MSVPSRMIWPDSWALLPWKRPMIAELDTDLPEPDSPTMPRVLPRSTV